jgi:serine/threonine-protein kinase
VGRVLDVADRALDVLAAVHDRGIVHCDIKPDNFILSGDRVVLLDFGIARANNFPDLPELPIEIVNEPIGTPDFMPPEQAIGRWDWVDVRSDLYALGASLFFLLSGRFVRDGLSVRSQLDAARRDRAPSLGLVAPGLRSVLTEVVDRALSFDPDARYASARAMQQSVRDARVRYTEGTEEELHARQKRNHASGHFLTARTIPTLGRRVVSRSRAS